MPTVFWSWQSDRPGRETRSLIRDALKSALDRIAVDLNEAERPELDHDTRGVPGSPDIVATILTKIEAAAVFVADVTPIVVTDAGKHVANPNVLIELGYAKRALGPERVILVWNTAFTDAKPEDLPFDMRHRRGPIAYALAEGADRQALREARASLAVRLEEAIKASLSAVPAPVPIAPRWRPNRVDELSIWQGGDEALMVNRGALDGSIQMSMDGTPRAYARLIPSKWEASPQALSLLDTSELHPIPLGGAGGLNWGPTQGGFLVYRSSSRIEEDGVTPTATRWFRDTGEFWGVASSFFSEHDGGSVLATSYAVERWLAWLKRSVELCRRLGGADPFHVQLGLDGISGTRWPPRGWGRDLQVEAIEADMHHAAILTDTSDEALAAVVEAAFAKVTEAYGLPALSAEQFQQMSR